MKKTDILSLSMVADEKDGVGTTTTTATNS
jgi:hypothetical protein